MCWSVVVQKQALIYGANNLWAELQTNVLGDRDLEVYYTENEAQSYDIVMRCVASGSKNFISVGTKGDFNALINALIDAKGDIPLSCFTIGHIDFVSAIKYGNSLMPEMQSFFSVKEQDKKAVGLVKAIFSKGDEHEYEQFFIKKSSIGIFADYMRILNQKRLIYASAGKTNQYFVRKGAALQTLFSYRKPLIVLECDGEKIDAEVTGLWIESLFEKGTVISEAEDLFSVNLLYGHHRFEIPFVLKKYKNGQLDKIPKSRSWQCAEISLHAETPFWFEMDGRCYEADKVFLSRFDEELIICG